MQLGNDIVYKHQHFRTMKTCLFSCLALLGVQCTHADETQFNDALRAANSGNSALLEQYRVSMQNDVLGYYPEYWSLNTNLGFQPASSIISFAQRYPQSAMAEKLAADYVEEKVKQADFATAKPVLNYVSNPDQAESCAVAQVRARTGDSLVYAEYKDIWLATNTQPESCNGLGRMMLSSPLMTKDDREQRLYAQLRAGQSGPAMATAQTLNSNLSLAQLNQIQANPVNYLWTAPKTSMTDYAYLVFALGRAADTDLNTALQTLPRLTQDVPADVQKYLYRTVAYVGGTTVMKNNFNRAVLDAFDQSYGVPFTDEEAEIYARQAVRFGRWESVIRAVESMSINQKQSERWQYWLARALEQRDDRSAKKTAQEIYNKLANAGDDYHNLLAKDHLGQRYNATAPTAQPSSSDLQRLNQDVHFRRAFTLRNINAPANYVNREWNWAVRQAYLKQDDGLLLAAAKRATEMGWYDRAIYAADRTAKTHNYEYRYATPHQATVVSYSQKAGIDPSWAYGLMRQESRFVTNARSHVGAGGLMQIMPATAKHVAAKMGESYNPAVSSDPNTNIRYGTFYLSMIHSQLSANPVLATAGYNAGPNRAKRWQPEQQPLNADQYVESIPLAETRDYVKNVMTNAVHYGILLKQGPQVIESRMPVIPTRTP